MSTSAGGAPAFSQRTLDNPGVRRMLRFAIGVTLATAYAYYVDWSYNFLAVIVVAGLLSAPLPAPSLRFALTFLPKYYFALLAGLFLILPVQHLPALGIALIALIIFLFHYAEALGKVGPLDGTMVLLGAVILPAMSGVSIDASIAFAKGFAKAGLLVFPVGWIAFAILPEKLFDRMPNIPPLRGDAVDCALYALAAVVVVVPAVVIVLSSNNTGTYLVMAMKVAQIVEQRSAERGRAFAFDMVFATLVGCAAGLVVWWLLKLWPSVFWYVLLTAMTSLFFGWRFTQGPGGIHPHAYRWVYGFMTIIILIAPDLLANDFTSDDPETRFYVRVLYFIVGTVYATAILYLIEGFREWRAARAASG